ncbi:hypothetical protein GQ602_002222 [Ophiocordyceps camponoti-floridani]|uniref:Uncharacterized protein n=1 Tax=Ophiocordyceps camponoti-floridani TaxID=2030778 RepID=A0A8H4QA14_9HYPO|nr:hypothetical protein GQ602_002222 [Ophiocordyceps camponoti-floridani]
MLHPLLPLILTVNAALGSMITHDHPVAQHFLSTLLGNINLDWSTPPTSETNQMSEKSCGMWIFKCARTLFKTKKTLVKRYPPLPGGWQMVEYRPNITAYFIPRLERGIMNLGDDDISFAADESTSTVDSTTEGWQIGAQISSSLGLSVSASFSKSQSAGTSQTKGVSIQTTCRAGYDCRIETWTYHLRITGYCQLRPVIDCDGEINPCQPNMGLMCDQYFDFRQRHCLGCGSASPFFHEKCQVQTPILDPAGRPFSRLVRISEKISEWSDEGLDGQQPPEKAIKFEDGLYQLETGEWYDDTDQTYYGNLDDNWYHKPGLPRPDLSLGAAVRRVCKSLPCHRELAQLAGGRRLIPSECERHRKVPDLTYRVEDIFFPWTPTCGRTTSKLRLQASDFSSVCNCVKEKRDGHGDACPDCKTSSCYRELIHMYGGSVDMLKRQCQHGELSKPEPRFYDVPNYPFDSYCGQVINYLHFQVDDFKSICECVEANHALHQAKASASQAEQRADVSRSRVGHSKRQESDNPKMPSRSQKKKKTIWKGGAEVEIEFLDEAPI